MPTPTIPDGSKYMYINLYTGTGGSQTLTNNSPSNPAGFQSGMQWFKSRSNATNNVLHDVLRGTAGINRIYSDSTAVQATTGDGFLSINSNGFSLDSSGSGGDVNTSGRTYVAWQWAAPASGTTNTSGTITSSVSANQTSGFSVVTYTGTGSSGSVGHGLSTLGIVPGLILLKCTSVAHDWRAFHGSFTSGDSYLRLNTTAATASSSTIWNGTLPTSSVFSVGTDGGTNQSGATFVAYCWAPIAGYSAFGSYTGNGSTDGTFVYLGFRPKFVMFKRTNTTGEWGIWDTSRSPYNAATFRLSANSSGAELDQAATTIDILSNGIKFRTADSDINASGSTYVYACWAENPFKYANAR